MPSGRDDPVAAHGFGGRFGAQRPRGDEIADVDTAARLKLDARDDVDRIDADERARKAANLTGMSASRSGSKSRHLRLRQRVAADRPEPAAPAERR